MKLDGLQPVRFPPVLRHEVGPEIGTALHSPKVLPLVVPMVPARLLQLERSLVPPMSLLTPPSFMQEKPDGLLEAHSRGVDIMKATVSGVR